MNQDELEVGYVNSTACESRGTRAYLSAELVILKKKHIAMHSDCVVIKLLSLFRFTFVPRLLTARSAAAARWQGCGIFCLDFSGMQRLSGAGAIGYRSRWRCY